MIQPIRTGKVIWTLYWVDLQEPVQWGPQLVLPTVILVCDSTGKSLEQPEVMPELDQARVEEFLGRLFERYGVPESLHVAENEEWDEQGWRRFSRDYQVDIRFSSQLVPDESGMKQAAELLSGKLAGAKPPSGSASEVAISLVESALRSRSPGKKVALLREALSRDTTCCPALIELADLDFQRSDWEAARKAYEAIVSRETPRWEGGKPAWWEDWATRPFLRALFGLAMISWQEGRYKRTARELERILTLNPRDHQGVRFHLPMVHLLREDPRGAKAFYDRYAREYPDDYQEPAFLMGWGLTEWLGDDEMAAKRPYRKAMGKNAYLPALLLDLPLPPTDLWLPNDRADLPYAQEFIESYATLWDRDAGAMRIVRETYEETLPALRRLEEHRRKMTDFQDQRYDPEYRATWKRLVEEDEQIANAI